MKKKIRSTKVLASDADWNRFVGICKMSGKSVQEVLGQYIESVKIPGSQGEGEVKKHEVGHRN